MTTFATYTDAVLSALTFNPKLDDQVARKQEILDGVYRTENLEPQSILFVGFTPAILSCRAKHIAVTEISDTALAFIKSKGVKFTHIDTAKLDQHRKQFDCVVAMDEYFTFANSDQEQQDKIAKICNLATAFVISTIRDYKNMDLKDRTLWTSRVYEIAEPNSSLVTYGKFERRTMFFKQLAKFSMDAGAVNFLVHKNLMYKSLVRKNYEHVVSIQFE